MKKTKILLASVSVASLAIGCGIFAACGGGGDSGNGGDPTYTVTFDANGGAYGEQTTVALTTGTNGKLTALPENAPTYADHEFNGYNTLANGTGDAVTVDTTYTTATTVYAQWVNVYTVTFVVGDSGELAAGASATAKTTMGKLSVLPEVNVTAAKKSFLGWYTTASGEGTEVTSEYTFSGDTTAVSVYARYRDEYTVTLSAGTDGTIKEGVTVSYTTVGGKIDGYLPGDEDVESTKANWHFGGWVDGENKDVDEREYEFTADTELTAKYVQNDGLWNEDGTEMIKALVLNTGATDCDEYWFGAGEKVELKANTVLTVYLDGKKRENFWLKGSCVDLSADVEGYGGVTTSSVKVSEDASFVVYIKNYPNGGTTYEFNGTPDRLPSTDALPEGAEAITITVKDPAAEEGAEALGTLTFYLVGKDGKSVKKTLAEGEAETYDSAANYQIHAWSSAGDHFGAWAENPTLDTELVLNYANLKDVTFKFHNDSGWETGNLNGMTLNGTYVINLQESWVKEYVAPASGGETETPAPDAE